MSTTERWLARSAARRPDHPALVSAAGTLSYAALESRAREVAARLRALGVTEGDRVALLLDNVPLYVEMVHALLGLDAVLVPLNTRLVAAELRAQLEDARPRLLVVADERLATARAAAGDLDGVRVISASGLEETEGRPGALSDRHELARDHAVLFTSGTTGRAKGVRLTLANQMASATASARRLGVDDADRWLACLPLYHVGGLAVLLRSALYATTVVLHEGFDATRVSAALAHDRISMVSLVPTMLARVLDAGAFNAPALRVVLLGGGPIPPALLERCHALNVPVAPTYGLTEAASQVATLDPAEALHADSAGRALDGTRLRIVDEHGKDRAPGEPGEILVSGPQVMAGYLDRPAETARTLADGWLHTGDLGTLDERGYLRVLERRTDLIVSGGENVYPAEVEAVLLAHPQVLEAGVVARSDSHWGQRVHAVVVPRPDASLTAEALDDWSRDQLAGFKRPRSYSIVDALPRTASGKLRREALRQAPD